MNDLGLALYKITRKINIFVVKTYREINFTNALLI